MKTTPIGFAGRFTGIPIHHKQAVEQEMQAIEKERNTTITVKEENGTLTIKTPDAVTPPDEMLKNAGTEARVFGTLMLKQGLKPKVDFQAHMTASKAQMADLGKALKGFLTGKP